MNLAADVIHTDLSRIVVEFLPPVDKQKLFSWGVGPEYFSFDQINDNVRSYMYKYMYMRNETSAAF